MMFARFAQEYGGQKLHIVRANANDKTVDSRAICGRDSSRRGSWRMTINMPLASLCKNCSRIACNVLIVEF